MIFPLTLALSPQAGEREYSNSSGKPAFREHSLSRLGGRGLG